MYKEEELYKKVEGHLNENEIKLLESLVDDINGFNKNHANNKVEVYIDYDNVGTDGEYDPYETFQIKLKPTIIKLNQKVVPVITSDLSLHDLDVAVCTLEGYFDELKFLLKPIEEEFFEHNNKVVQYYEDAKKDKRVLYSDLCGFKTQRLDEISRQFIDGILYDINRLPETIIALKNNDIDKFSQHWVNDLALVELLKYYYNRCAELEGKLKLAEDKNIVNQIMK